MRGLPVTGGLFIGASGRYTYPMITCKVTLTPKGDVRALVVDGHSTSEICGPVSGIVLLLRNLVGGTSIHGEGGYYALNFTDRNQSVGSAAVETFAKIAASGQGQGNLKMDYKVLDG